MPFTFSGPIYAKECAMMGVMKRLMVLWCLAVCARAQKFEVSVPWSVHSAPITGRVFVMLSQRDSPAWWGLAETALGRGRPDEAIDWCERGYEASSAVRDAAYLYPYLVTGTRAFLARDDGTGAGDWVDRVAQLLLLRRIPGTLGAIEHAKRRAPEQD